MIYLDNNATTPVDPRVREVMVQFLADKFGNPSSSHSFGRAARAALEAAREQVADLLGAKAEGVVFTGGGTESINMALRGALKAQPSKRHIVTTAVEHSATRVLCAQLEREGYEVTWLGVDEVGQIDFGEYLNALRDDTALVSVIWANNETGVILPIEAMANVADERRIVFHTDAVQAAGKVSIDMRSVPAHLVSIAAHKFYGAKGTGALFVRPGLGLPPLLYGGGQENGRRAGTENMAGIVGMGVAASLAKTEMEGEIRRVAEMRDDFEEQVLSTFEGSRVHGASDIARLPNTSNFSIGGVRARDLLPVLDHLGMACSLGSACSSGSSKPSHVLLAMGVSEDEAASSLRVSFGRMNTAIEVSSALAVLSEAVVRGQKNEADG